ncbi:MAG: biphenyl-2,3-diol 1,2-dioxygenase [Panacagrimonas sp.]
MNVQRLGYVGFEASDVEAWRGFSTAMLGAMEAPAVDDALRFRIDSRTWRYAVHPGSADDIRYAGFEVSSRDALLQINEHLKKLGIAVHHENETFARSRGVLDLLSCSDPFGTRIEIYYGATEIFEKPLVSPAGVSGFVTGDQGFGHLVLNVPDLKQAEDFYVKALGFELSDVIDWTVANGQTLRISFYNCNGRHHTLALMSTPSPKKLHHFMIEAASLDDVGLAYDRFTDAGSVVMTLGRHTNDHMFSFYGATPSGFAVEFGWGARPVDSSWSTTRYEKISIWGHRLAQAGA